MNNPVYFIDPDGMASVGLSSNERAMFGMGPRPGTTKSTIEQQDDAAAASMERAVANGSKASGDDSDSGDNVDSGDQEDPKKKRTNSGKGRKAPTLDQANEHYRNGGGDPYYVDASTVDLNFLYTKTENWIEGKTYLIRTLLNSQQGKVFGKLLVTYKGNNQVEIVANTYDFNMEFSNPLKVSEFLSPRNVLTALAEVYAGEGPPFDFVFTGLNTIEAPSIIPQPYLYKQYP